MRLFSIAHGRGQARTHAKNVVVMLNRRPIVDGKIFNSKGDQVGVLTGGAIYSLRGHKLYELKGANIYNLSGELMGHLNASHGSEIRLDRFNERLFLEK
jgi:hypothetical protein